MEQTGTRKLLFFDRTDAVDTWPAIERRANVFSQNKRKEQEEQTRANA